MIISLLIVFILTQLTNKQVEGIKKESCSKWSSYPSLAVPYASSKNCYKDPVVSAEGQTTKLIEQLGYKYDPHTFTTPDGYIVTIFRITQASGSPNKGQTVYMQHGVAMDSSTFIYTQNNSYAYYLFEQGYDVWLGNIRASQYGRKHIHMSDKDPKFWDFSVDDLQENDLTTALSTVANVTGNAGEIIYVGHSMGTTMMFMYLADNPNQKIVKAFIAFSPVVYFEDITLNDLIKFIPVNFLYHVTELLHFTAVFTNSDLTHTFFERFCVLAPRICMMIFVDSLLGQSDLFVPGFLTEYFSVWPSPISIKMLAQFGQIAKSDKFAKFDYGSRKNKKVYNSSEPSLYDLGNINIPTYLFHGKHDALVSTTAADRIIKELGSSDKDSKVVPINNNKSEDIFGHAQMFQLLNGKELLFDDVQKYLDNLK